MTFPRQVVSGRTYLLTRRCAQRQFLLRPDPRIRQIFLYCLADAASRYDMTLHGYMAMSNHHHLAVRDNSANLPDFMACLNRMSSKAINAHWGRWENVWANEQPSAVHLAGAETRFIKLVYLLANPVRAHLVERAADWPGASSLEQTRSGRPITIARPDVFFPADSKMPPVVTLRLERPDGFEHLTATEWLDRIEHALRVVEEGAREERAKKQWSVVGREAVMRAAHTDRPTTIEPRRGRRPHVACADRERRKLELDEILRFRSTHREARESLRAGDRAAQFPEGTYKMRRLGLAQDEAPELTKDGKLTKDETPGTNQGRETNHGRGVIRSAR